MMSTAFSQITLPRFALEFHKAKWSDCIALRTNLQQLCRRLIYLMWMRLTRNFVIIIKKAAKKMNPRGHQNKNILCWDA